MKKITALLALILSLTVYASIASAQQPTNETKVAPQIVCQDGSRCLKICPGGGIANSNLPCPPDGGANFPAYYGGQIVVGATGYQAVSAAPEGVQIAPGFWQITNCSGSGANVTLNGALEQEFTVWNDAADCLATPPPGFAFGSTAAGGTVQAPNQPTTLVAGVRTVMVCHAAGAICEAADEALHTFTGAVAVESADGIEVPPAPSITASGGLAPHTWTLPVVGGFPQRDGTDVTGYHLQILFYSQNTGSDPHLVFGQTGESSTGWVSKADTEAWAEASCPVLVATGQSICVPSALYSLVIGTTGFIIDNAGRRYSILTSSQVGLFGVADTTTSHADMIGYFPGPDGNDDVYYRDTITGWFYYNTGQTLWVATSDPRQSPIGTRLDATGASVNSFLRLAGDIYSLSTNADPNFQCTLAGTTAPIVCKDPPAAPPWFTSAVKYLEIGPDNLLYQMNTANNYFKLSGVQWLATTDPYANSVTLTAFNTANPPQPITQVTAGTPITLSYTSAGRVQSCKLDDGGTFSQTGGPSGTGIAYTMGSVAVTFTVNCKNELETATRTATVSIINPSLVMDYFRINGGPGPVTITLGATVALTGHATETGGSITTCDDQGSGWPAAGNTTISSSSDTLHDIATTSFTDTPTGSKTYKYRCTDGSGKVASATPVSVIVTSGTVESAEQDFITAGTNAASKILVDGAGISYALSGNTTIIPGHSPNTYGGCANPGGANGFWVCQVAVGGASATAVGFSSFVSELRYHHDPNTGIGHVYQTNQSLYGPNGAALYTTPTPPPFNWWEWIASAWVVQPYPGTAAVTMTANGQSAITVNAGTSVTLLGTYTDVAGCTTNPSLGWTC